MGYYFNPPDDLLLEGRRLEASDYKGLVAQLEEGEVLVGLYDRFIFKNAPYLYSEAEFNEFERQGLIQQGYFAVPREILEAQNGGTVPNQQ